jgi:hypothetical protein
MMRTVGSVMTIIITLDTLHCTFKVEATDYLITGFVSDFGS